MSQLISTAINHIELFQSSFLCDVKSCKLWVIVEDDDDDSSPILTSFRVFTPDIVCFSFTWYGGAGGAGCQLPSLLLLQSRRAGPCPGTGGDTRSSWRLAGLLSWRSLWRSDTVTVSVQTSRYKTQGFPPSRPVHICHSSCSHTG